LRDNSAFRSGQTEIHDELTTIIEDILQRTDAVQLIKNNKVDADLAKEIADMEQQSQAT
jgi:flagellin-like hook-associated protein FlgL